MSILNDLQNDLVDTQKPISPILLKLRLLAAKLGSEDLEAWVKFESEGYPTEAELPDYRKLSMAMNGHFDFGFGKQIRNAPIPSLLVKEEVGEQWTYFSLRESAAAIDSMIESCGEGLSLDLSNLILVLQGKVYEGAACQQIKGFVGKASLVEASNAVRNRLLELTIELEKKLPNSDEIELSTVVASPEIAHRALHQTVYGNITNIHSSGADATINLTVSAQDEQSLLNNLKAAGLDDFSAAEVAEIIAEEMPDKTNNNSIGKKLRGWLGEKIGEGIDASIKGGTAALTKIVQEAALQYWGLK